MMTAVLALFTVAMLMVLGRVTFVQGGTAEIAAVHLKRYKRSLLLQERIQ
jgi:hypothetical protein